MRTPWQLWTVAFGAILGASLYFSVPAKADPVSNYAAYNHDAICQTLDAFPTFDGIEGVGLGIVQDTGWSLPDAGLVIQESIGGYCQRHIALWNRFVATYRTRGVIV